MLHFPSPECPRKRQLTHTGKQGDQQTTPKMQGVDVFHYIANNAVRLSSSWGRDTRRQRLHSAQLIPADSGRGREALPAPTERTSHMQSLSQGCVFMISLSRSRRLKHVPESVLSLHRNSQSTQMMNNTRHNKWSFPTLILSILSCKVTLSKTISSLPNLLVLTPSSQHKTCLG